MFLEAATVLANASGAKIECDLTRAGTKNPAFFYEIRILIATRTADDLRAGNAIGACRVGFVEDSHVGTQGSDCTCKRVRGAT